ncbi:MAG: hypothetical protein L0Z63_11040 [Actinobacteria bacterium]|nr:hypothetical protein [Actinomycetota bacterium]
MTRRSALVMSVERHPICGAGSTYLPPILVERCTAAVPWARPVDPRI